MCDQRRPANGCEERLYMVGEVMQNGSVKKGCTWSVNLQNGSVKTKLMWCMVGEEL